jgi:hypothetical protein
MAKKGNICSNTWFVHKFKSLLYIYAYRTSCTILIHNIYLQKYLKTFVAHSIFFTAQQKCHPILVRFVSKKLLLLLLLLFYRIKNKQKN